MFSNEVVAPWGTYWEDGAPDRKMNAEDVKAYAVSAGMI
jgi:hypothetical protein